MIGNFIYLLFGAPGGILVVFLQYQLCKNVRNKFIRLIPAFIFALAELCGFLLISEPVASLVGLDTLAGYLVIYCGIGYGILVGLGWMAWSFLRSKER